MLGQRLVLETRNSTRQWLARARDGMYARIIERCRSESRPAFVEQKGSDVLDASVLMIEALGV